MPQTAKLFANGRSQAVRLPAMYRFDASEVFIRRDDATGDIILSRRPETWDGFFEAVHAATIPDDFLHRDGAQSVHPPRDPFAQWQE